VLILDTDSNVPAGNELLQSSLLLCIIRSSYCIESSKEQP
jgi:hypothetical protein